MTDLLFFWTSGMQEARSLIGNGLSYSKENSNHWTWFFDFQEPIFQQFVLNWFSFVDEAKWDLFSHCYCYSLFFVNIQNQLFITSHSLLIISY